MFSLVLIASVCVYARMSLIFLLLLLVSHLPLLLRGGEVHLLK